MQCAFSISGVSRIQEGCKVGTLSQPNSPRGARAREDKALVLGGALMKDVQLSLRRNRLQLLSRDLLEDELASVVLAPSRAGLQASNPRTPIRGCSYLLFSLLLHILQPASSQLCSSQGICCCPSSGKVDRTCLSLLQCEQDRPW